MILFVSGATGGHIYPGVALAQTLNLPAHFVVSREYPAKSILAPYKLPFQVIGFSVKRVLLFPILASQILRVLLKKRPQMIIAMGVEYAFHSPLWGGVFVFLLFHLNKMPYLAEQPVPYNFFVKRLSQLLNLLKMGCMQNPKSCAWGIPHVCITQ